MMEKLLEKLKSADYTGVIADTTELLQQDDSNDEAYYFRAIAKKETGDFEGAIQDATFSIHHYPRGFVAYLVRAEAKKELNDLEGVIEDASDVIKLNKNAYEAYLIRAEARKKMNDLDGAISDATNAIRLNNKSVEAYQIRQQAYSENNQLGFAFKDELRIYSLRKRKEVYSLQAMTKFFILNRHGHIMITGVQNFKGDFDNLKSTLIDFNITPDTIALTREVQGYPVTTLDLFNKLDNEELKRLKMQSLLEKSSESEKTEVQRAPILMKR